MKYLLLFHGNNGYANAPECYVIRTLPVLWVFSSYCSFWVPFILVYALFPSMLAQFLLKGILIMIIVLPLSALKLSMVDLGTSWNFVLWYLVECKVTGWLPCEYSPDLSFRLPYIMSNWNWDGHKSRTYRNMSCEVRAVRQKLQTYCRT